MASNNPSGNISPEKLSALLKLASNRLGMSPDQLKSVLSDKKSTEELLDKLGAKNQYEAAMKDPDSLDKMLNSNPKAKKILNDLMGDQKHG